jgi:hypothetical protein
MSVESVLEAGHGGNVRDDVGAREHPLAHIRPPLSYAAADAEPRMRRAVPNGCHPATSVTRARRLAGYAASGAPR